MLPVPLIDCVPVYCSRLLLSVTVALLRVRPPTMVVVPLTFRPVAKTTWFKVPLFAVSNVPLPEEISPPLRARVAEPPSVAVPPNAASELALSTNPSVPTEEEIPALMLMLLCAVSVSVALPPAVLLMALLIVMSPFCTPPALVVMVTLMPALSAA